MTSIAATRFFTITSQLEMKSIVGQEEGRETCMESELIAAIFSNVEFFMVLSTSCSLLISPYHPHFIEIDARND